jgi:hypothetical protein
VIEIDAPALRDQLVSITCHTVGVDGRGGEVRRAATVRILDPDLQITRGDVEIIDIRGVAGGVEALRALRQGIRRGDDRR